MRHHEPARHVAIETSPLLHAEHADEAPCTPPPPPIGRSTQEEPASDGQSDVAWVWAHRAGRKKGCRGILTEAPSTASILTDAPSTASILTEVPSTASIHTDAPSTFKIKPQPFLFVCIICKDAWEYFFCLFSYVLSKDGWE